MLYTIHMLETHYVFPLRKVTTEYNEFNEYDYELSLYYALCFRCAYSGTLYPRRQQNWVFHLQVTFLKLLSACPNYFLTTTVCIAFTRF